MATLARPAVILLLAFAGCSKTPAAPYGETAEWRAWRGSLLQIPVAGFATRIDGSIDFQLGNRPCGNEDWIEIAYQGEVVARKYIYSPPGTPPRIVRYDTKLLTGPVNRIEFFDTVTNRGYKFMIDTRTLDGHAPHIVFSPGPDGFSFIQH